MLDVDGRSGGGSGGRGGTGWPEVPEPPSRDDEFADLGPGSNSTRRAPLEEGRPPLDERSHR